LAILEDLPRQTAALAAVRDELEAALAGDENWRALRTGASGADADPKRRDRDARLVKALEANPLYLAWTHVCQAIDALGAATSEAAQGTIELSGTGSARGDAATRADAGRQTGKDRLGGKLATIPALQSVEARGKAAAEPVAAAVLAKPEGDLPPPRIAEPAEAKVSFVRRQASVPAAKAPADVAARAAANDGNFVPAAEAVEEADVAIVNAPVRRFLKALSGD
jgi:hypothetical protein